MLEPGERSDLVESLRPPPGMHLDAAVGTTYTLDLDALMGVCAAFSADRAVRSQDGDTDGLEPVALLDAVRRTARRFAIFCQAGAIRTPPRARPVFTWLEEAIVQCRAPRGGVFHPKIWLLRYLGPDGAEALRLLCLSRNISFGRSWDLVLRLDADLSAGAPARSLDETGPRVAGFVRGLLDEGVATGEVPASTRLLVERVAECAGRARFLPPEGFREVNVWPMGFGGTPMDRPEAKARVLVCAPFIGAPMLRHWAPEKRDPSAGPHVLISRPEAVDALGSGGTAHFGDVFVMSPEADLDDSDGGGAGAGGALGDLRGLHAKLFMVETGSTVRTIVGSPNATTAAFETNVEFACELIGRTRDVGIDAVLAARPGEVRLINLLTHYTPADEPTPPDPTEDLAFALQQLAAEVTTAGWSVRVLPAGGVEVSRKGPVTADMDGVQVSCRPIALPPGRAQSLDMDRIAPVVFECTPQAVTSFLEFTLQLTRDGVVSDASFVVNAQLIDAPDDRADRVLAELLADPSRFVEYLLLLLGDEDGGFGDAGGSAAWRSAASALAGGDGAPPLLEVLLRAASRAPESLAHVAALVEGLRKTAEGRAALPPGFDEVWDVVWAVCADRDPE